MSIKGVDPTCYILALFVRDDGERFLLGSGSYVFKGKQMHFQANTIQNDAVEVQGADGYLLAGQVRRPGSQDFDGYVGSGTASKTEVEANRRAFFSFFRKNYFYKVVYVFPNGTAIQRKRGFLVDDPTVKELYQVNPEYHVALNFEDVNYYSYSENDEGEEIYAKDAIIHLSAGASSGGLVWDAVGVEWEAIVWSNVLNASGSEFVILNNAGARAPLSDIQLNGDTFQQTYSGKNLMPPLTNGTITGKSQTFSNARITINQAFNYTKELTYADGVFSGMPTQGTGSYYIWYATITGLEANTQYTISVDYSVTLTEVSNFIAIGSIKPSAPVGTSTGKFSKTITTDANGEYAFSSSGNAFINAYLDKNQTTAFTLSNLQIEKGSQDTSFEPYVGGTASPNPDYPQDINVVTGEQTVTISDGTNSEDFTVDLGSTELAKIGTYQDYIYKSGDDWYVHKAIGKVVFDGTEGWNYDSAVPRLYLSATTLTTLGISPIFPTSANYSPSGFTNRFIGKSFTDFYTNSQSNGFAMSTVGRNFQVGYKKWQSQSDAEADVNGLVWFYALATPTDTKITDATLIGQLEAVLAMKLLLGTNNVEVSATAPNLPAILDVDYFTEWGGGGAVWEEGGPAGPTIVEVDSIDTVYPIWQVTGPATNPQLTVLTTNTTIQYNGNITSSQILEIDMFNKTATLNGASVIGNVSGDWIQFAPGNNRVTYTADNADAPESKIMWQEIVG